MLNLILLRPKFLQNYYYILQDSEWRSDNDWIHVDANGIIQSPLVAIHNCKVTNIRPRTDCSGYSIKIYFENELSKNFDKMKSVVPQLDRLKKVFNSTLTSANSFHIFCL